MQQPEPTDAARTPRPEAVGALKRRLAELQETDSDMSTLAIHDVGLEPSDGTIRVVFTHDRFPHRVVGVRLNADLRLFPPPPGPDNRRLREAEWLSLLPHEFVEVFWTYRSTHLADDGITWLEMSPQAGDPTSE